MSLAAFARLGWLHSQKIGRVEENRGHQPLRGVTAEDFDPFLGGDSVARGLSIGPRFLTGFTMDLTFWNQEWPLS